MDTKQEGIKLASNWIAGSFNIVENSGLKTSAKIFHKTDANFGRPKTPTRNITRLYDTHLGGSQSQGIKIQMLRLRGD